MSNNLSVKITADVVDLQTKFGIAKAETQALSAEFNNLAKQSAAGSLDAAGQARFQQLSGDLLAARTQAAGYARDLRDAGFAATGFGTAAVQAAEGATKLGIHTSSAVRYTRELFDEISSGRTRYLPSTLAELAQQGFGLSPAMLAGAAGVAALVAGLGYLIYSAVEASNKLDGLHLAALRAGNEFTRTQLDELTSQLAQLPSVSHSSAEEITSALAAIHLPFQALEAATRIAAEQMAQTGQSGKQAGEEIAKALEPTMTATEVAKKYQNDLTQAQVEAAEQADKNGDANAILAEKLQLLSAPLSRARADVQEYGRSWGRAFFEAGAEIGLANQDIDGQAEVLKENKEQWSANAKAIAQYTADLQSLPAQKALVFQTQSGGVENAALAAAENAANIKHALAEREIEDASRALDQLAAEQERASAQALTAAEHAADVKHQLAEQEIQQADRTLAELAAKQQLADDQRLENERRVVRGIESAENTMISGLLRGRQSFAQVAQQTAIRLAEREIQAAAHAVTERLILQRSGAAAEKSVASELGMKTVMQDAGKAAAGAYSAVAAIPYVGPFLAPAAAATAYAGVMAFEGLASLDVGTPYIPETGLYTLHEGEAVMPKTWAEGMRDGDIGGGAGMSESHHYNGDTHIHAMDTQDMARALKRNRGGLAAGLVRAYRRGAFNS